MLKLEKITQAAFYRETNGRQVTHLGCGWTADVSSINIESLVTNIREGATGKLVKRSNDFYRILPDGSRSFGTASGCIVHKTEHAGKTIYILENTEEPWHDYPESCFFGKHQVLIYRLEEA